MSRPASRGKESFPGLKVPENRSAPGEQPQPLGDVLGQLFALRGYGRIRTERQLHEAWERVAGERIAKHSKVIGLRSGILQVAVSNSALLGELASFYKEELLEKLRNEYRDVWIRDLKFRLRGQSR